MKLKIAVLLKILLLHMIVFIKYLQRVRFRHDTDVVYRRPKSGRHPQH